MNMKKIGMILAVILLLCTASFAYQCQTQDRQGLVDLMKDYLAALVAHDPSAVPFDKYVKGQFLTYAAIIINAENGSFEEASWVEEPTRFIQISREKAIEMVLSENADLLNMELNAELIWEPNSYSQSPFYPYWKVISGNEIYFVTQDGEVITEDV